MRHQSVCRALVGFCWLVLAIPAQGQDAKAPEKETFLLPPAMIPPPVKVVSIEADGSIALDSIPQQAQLHVPFWPTAEGFYLAMTPQANNQPMPGARALTSLVKLEVVEVEGTSLKAKSGPEVSSALKVGDLIILVRPSRMTTAQMRSLPSVIPLVKEGEAGVAGKMSDGVAKARQAAQMAQSVNNLKQIGLAMHNFHSTMGNFPPAVVYGPDGKPWHSWRVLILPYIEQTGLYNQYDFAQPWDSPKNLALLDKMPSVYRDPLDGQTTGSNTNYAAVVGEGTVFSPQGSRIKIENGRASNELYKGRGIRDITDGTSNTIMVVPVDPARNIPWTKPDDIAVGANFPGLGKPGGIFTPAKLDGSGVAPILFADGSVKVLSDKTKPEVIRNLTTIAGGEIIDADSLISSNMPRPGGPGQMPTLHLFRDGKNVSAIIE